MRKIIHIDMDAFYASVEQRDNPHLRGKPVVVGSPKARGVIAAASYEARKYGVRSAMPAKLALKKCKDLIFVSHRLGVYQAVSVQIHDIFQRYTDIIEPLSLDEAFLDVTHNKTGQRSATLIAEEIRTAIWQELNLTASAGVSYNKFLAKIASDWNKPNGIFTIIPSKAQSFIDDLPIEKFFGVGPRTAEKMHSLKIFKGEDLKTFEQVELIRHFGKTGTYYYRIARGIDNREVQAHRVRKSIGAERTFSEDFNSHQDLSVKLMQITDELWNRVERKKQYGRTITLKVKFADFKQITRSESFSNPVQDKVYLEQKLLELLAKIDVKEGVRLLGGSVSNFPDENSPVQLSFDFF